MSKSTKYDLKSTSIVFTKIKSHAARYDMKRYDARYDMKNPYCYDLNYTNRTAAEIGERFKKVLIDTLESMDFNQAESITLIATWE